MSGRLLARARLAVYAALVVVVAFSVWRYDLVGLPEAGCSPLVGIAPGDRLVVERRLRRASRPGDVMLYRVPGAGELLLGRVAPPPASAPATVHDAVARGALWIVSERPDCPSPDSRRHGPLAPSAVEGRVVLTLPW